MYVNAYMYIYLGYHIINMAAIIAIIIDVHVGSNEATKPGTEDDLTEMTNYFDWSSLQGYIVQG